MYESTRVLFPTDHCVSALFRSSLVCLCYLTDSFGVCVLSYGYHVRAVVVCVLTKTYCLFKKPNKNKKAVSV